MKANALPQILVILQVLQDSSFLLAKGTDISENSSSIIGKEHVRLRIRTTDSNTFVSNSYLSIHPPTIRFITARRPDLSSLLFSLSFFWKEKGGGVINNSAATLKRKSSKDSLSYQLTVF